MKVVRVSQHRPLSQSADEVAGAISVIVPAYNAAKTLPGALRSVAEQTLSPLEILVVDDASRDDTVEVARGFDDDRVRVLALEANAGPSAARNAGLSEARGEFVAFLDADDTWKPRKLELQHALISRDPDLAIVSCDSEYYTPEGKLKRRSHAVLPPGTGPDGWKTLLEYNFMPTPTVMGRREQFCRLGGFDTGLEFGEDLDLWIRASVEGEIAVVEEVLVDIIEWSGSLTGTIRHRQPEFVLPYIARYLDQEAHRLTREEARRIRGRRYYESGTVLFYSGRTFSSLRYFWRSALLGERPWKSLSFFPKAVVSLLTGGRYPGTTH